MKTWYNIEVQMLGENERTNELDEAVGWELGFAEGDIDERDLYRLTALFSSEITHDRMRKDVRKVLDEHPDIFYIDVIYRWDSENVPDRFVMWQDGRTKNYIGHIVFEEEKADE